MRCHSEAAHMAPGDACDTQCQCTQIPMQRTRHEHLHWLAFGWLKRLKYVHPALGGWPACTPPAC